MKLYVNSRGEWVGTQAEAKKINAVQVDVPVSKQELLEFLNREQVCRSIATHGSPQTQTAAPVYQSKLLKPHAWQTIKECAEKASFKDLGVALAVVMNRLDEAADKEATKEPKPEPRKRVDTLGQMLRF